MLRCILSQTENILLGGMKCSCSFPGASFPNFGKFSVCINSPAPGNCAADALTMQPEVFQDFLDATGLQGQPQLHICTGRIMVNKDAAEGNRKNISCLASLTNCISAIKRLC